MVQYKYHLLKEQLSTMSSLSTYILGVLEGPVCTTLFESDTSSSYCCQHEQLLVNIIVEDCTDLGTLMIKALLRLQRKLKDHPNVFETEYSYGDPQVQHTISLAQSSEYPKLHTDEEGLCDKEVSTTSIFDTLAKVTDSNFLESSTKPEVIEIKSEGEDNADNEEGTPFPIGFASLLPTVTGTLNEVAAGRFVLGATRQEEPCKEQCQERMEKKETLPEAKENGNKGSKIDKETRTFTCSLCGKVLASYKNYVRHRKVHKESGKYNCKSCLKVFQQETSFKRHFASCHAQKGTTSFGCGSCRKSFASQSDLDKHMAEHGGREPYACTACCLSFVSLFEYQVHQDTEHTSQEFPCETCDKVFSNCRSLQRHRYLHSTQKSYPCQRCSKQFVTSFDLKKHTLTHASPTDFMCQVCNKAYSSESSLKRHSLLHKQSSKVHACSQCNYTFALLSDLEEHHKMAHSMAFSGFKEGSHGDSGKTKTTSKQLTACQLCGKHYSSRRNLIRHKLLHNRGSQHPCRLCNKKFINSFQLRCHASTHMTSAQSKDTSTASLPFSKTINVVPTCDLCHKTFKHRKSLRKHLILHKKKSFCLVCKKFFSSEEVLSSHKFSSLCGSADLSTKRTPSAQVLENSDSLSTTPRKQSTEVERSINATGTERAGQRQSSRHCCPVCQKEFRKRQFMRRHLALHNVKPFCDLCKRFFITTDAFDRHLQMHASDDNLVCDTCHKVFSSRRALTIHRRLHMRHKLHICSICNKGFPTPSSFRKHARTHTVERSWHEVSVSTVSDDRGRKAGHGKSFECEVCKRFFMSEFHLRMHSTIHTKHLSVKSDVGDNGRAGNERHSSSALEGKQQTNTDLGKVGTLRCLHCLQLFQGPMELKSHLSTSTCSPFKCHICGDLFPSSKEREDHFCRAADSHSTIELEEGEILISPNVSSRFSPREIYPVDGSLQSSYSVSGSEVHFDEVERSVLLEENPSIFPTTDREDTSDSAYHCRNCSAAFESRQTLEVHKLDCLPRERFECQTCGKLFESPKRLRSHEFQHMDEVERPWKCEICPRAFGTKAYLKRHALLHSDYRSHTCHICGKGYVRSDSLKYHLTTHEREGGS